MAETSEAPYSRRTDSRDNPLTNPSRKPSQARYIINDFILHPRARRKGSLWNPPGSPRRHVILSMILFYTIGREKSPLAETHPKALPSRSQGHTVRLYPHPSPLEPLPAALLLLGGLKRERLGGLVVERLSALHGLGAVGNGLHELGYLLVLLGELLD